MWDLLTVSVTLHEPIKVVKLDCTSFIVIILLAWLTDAIESSSFHSREQKDVAVRACLYVCLNAFLSRLFPVCFCPFTVVLALKISLSVPYFHTYLCLTHTHTHTDFQSLFTLGLAKLLSEQMTKNKTVTSSLPTSPMLSVMVHINQTKLPWTQGSLFSPTLPSTWPL